MGGGGQSPNVSGRMLTMAGLFDIWRRRPNVSDCVLDCLQTISFPGFPRLQFLIACSQGVGTRLGSESMPPKEKQAPYVSSEQAPKSSDTPIFRPCGFVEN